MEVSVEKSVDNVVLEPVVSESPEQVPVCSTDKVAVRKTVPSMKKIAGPDGTTKKRVNVVKTAKPGVASSSRVTRTPHAMQAGLRRKSTGTMGEKLPAPIIKQVDSATSSIERKKTGSAVSDQVRRSLPEMRSDSINSDGGNSSRVASVGSTKRSGLASPSATTLRMNVNSITSRSDSVNKSLATWSTHASSRKVNFPSLDGMSSSTTSRSISKSSKPSSEPPSVTSGLKRASRLSPSLVRSPTQRSGVKSSSMPSLPHQGSNVYGRKKAVTPEHRDSQFIILPPVEIKCGNDVRLDLRGQRIRNLNASGMNLSQNLEFVYLRDNLLCSLEGVEILKHVKVLDLSFNDFKGPGFEPLGNCQVLQQLYLAGNQITSLSSLPELPNLKFLSVAQNKLKSLSMASQPRLQVLAASKNKVSSLKGFPHLPALENLRVEENPILKMPHLEAASILLVGPTLKSFNDKDLSEEEIAIAKRYPAHTAFCIRNGWEFCSPDLAAESTFNFLLERWNDQLPPGFQLKEASMDSPFEEDPCRCHFIFLQDHGIDTKLELKYQWYVGEGALITFSAIPGAISEVYCPRHEDVEKYLKVECTPILEEIEYPPIFALSSLVSPGTGCPKVLNLDVHGDLVEGNIIRGYADVAWCGGCPGKSVASWLRRKWNSSPVAITGAEEEEYQLTLDDIDSSLAFMYTAVTREGTKGEPQYAITDFVKAAPPSVSNVRIMGDYVEGNVITGVGDYFGGREGPSKFEWLRENTDLREFELVLTGAAEYSLTREDVGCRMAFVYIPVNFEGKEGESVSVVSDVVKQAPPKVTNTRIIGELREGSKITVTGTVTGGTEGSSRVQWFKSSSLTFSAEDELETLSTSKIAKAFRIPLGAVGNYIVAKFTPMAPDGDVGEPAYVISESTVQTRPPSLNFLSVTGDYVEGEILTASYGYIGGHEGKSIYDWYLHQAKTDTGTIIEEASGHLQYRIPKEAIGKFISFKCIPVRDDGMIGEPGICMGSDCVRAGNPKLQSMQIVGKSVEGSMLIADKRYWGGEEGDSIYQWFRNGIDGKESEINGAITASYILSMDDIGYLISVSCEPVRSDWARGPVVFSEQFGPVFPGPPTCQALEFSGAMIEGQHLTYRAIYCGGGRGNCFCEWFRVKNNGSRERICLNESMDLTLEDVGCRVEMVFTPVRNDGERGKPKSIISDVIVPADPVGIELTIPVCCEAKEVLPQKRYFGGHEGVGEYIWYRAKDKLEGSALSGIFGSSENVIACGRDLTYKPSIDDVGFYLALYWVPTREDGIHGKPLVAICDDPVVAAHPEVYNVCVKVLTMSTYVGEGEYFGGNEGSSLFSWYRESADGTINLICDAESLTYEVTDSDYNCRLLFGYTPVRSDMVVGELKLSDPTDVILPELLKIEVLALTGLAVEGDILTAVEIIPNSEQQQIVWSKYKKEVEYQWYYYSSDVGDAKNFEILSSQRSCSYRLCFEDIGHSLRCECIVSDVFGRSSEPAYAESRVILPGIPRIDKLEIEGRGFHTNLYAIRGIYSGGKEGKSRIQWLRSMVGSPDLISIPGETGRMYEANVDDVGYRLVVIYTPVREDGAEGQPVSASTEPIAIEPDVFEEVKKKLDVGSVKFEVLCDKAPASKKVLDIGGLERRILEINRKRVKVVKPGSKTSFPSTEMRGTYAPPFHVELFGNDQHQLRIVVDSESEVDIMVHTRHLRDVIVLILRGLAQKFNSTSLNTLLKIES